MWRSQLSCDRSINVLLLVAVFWTTSAATIASQTSRSSASPEEVVRQFYDSYLHAHFPEPKKQNLVTFRKYVTQRFLKRAMAPDVDAVLFVDAQDADDTWADKFSVSK